MRVTKVTGFFLAGSARGGLQPPPRRYGARETLRYLVDRHCLHRSKAFCETHHFQRHSRSIVLSPVGNPKKHWRARVVLAVRTTGEDGRLVNILPGEYTLSEEEGARYQLIRCAENPIRLSLWFADILRCTYMGQLEILGVWP